MLVSFRCDRCSYELTEDRRAVLAPLSGEKCPSCGELAWRAVAIDASTPGDTAAPACVFLPHKGADGAFLQRKTGEILGSIQTPEGLRPAILRPDGQVIEAPTSRQVPTGAPEFELSADAIASLGSPIPLHPDDPRIPKIMAAIAPGPLHMAKLNMPSEPTTKPNPFTATEGREHRRWRQVRASFPLNYPTVATITIRQDSEPDGEFREPPRIRTDSGEDIKGLTRSESNTLARRIEEAWTAFQARWPQ